MPNAVNSPGKNPAGKDGPCAIWLLLDSIEKIPGRKAILYFQQNGLLFPNEIYGVSNLTAADHVQTIEEVGASATQSRAAIYTAYTGGMECFLKTKRSMYTGANLADMTGGGYNRGPQDLDELLDQAGRECRCFYRLALELRPVPAEGFINCGSRSAGRIFRGFHGSLSSAPTSVETGSPVRSVASSGSSRSIP